MLTFRQIRDLDFAPCRLRVLGHGEIEKPPEHSGTFTLPGVFRHRLRSGPAVNLYFFTRQRFEAHRPGRIRSEVVLRVKIVVDCVRFEVPQISGFRSSKRRGAFEKGSTSVVMLQVRRSVT